MANVVYESDRMTVVDDREFISIAEAIDLLISGSDISVCDFPDYGAENEWEIYSSPFRISLRDALSDETIEGWNAGRINENVVRGELVGYLSGYEISR